MKSEGTVSPAQQLATTFSGRVIEPADPAYDGVRRVHNGLIDKRPALIAECRGVADVVDAVKLARDQGLEIAVRGGGHNVGGRATVDGGVMIDLSQMRGVHVDPATRTAQAEGGTLWKIFNRETQVHGLATTGGVVGTTGIGGLTLGGGLGWLMPKHGMALDNLKSVDLVLADGKVARASALENQDLFWAVRGGGGNFGIATSFEFALHPIGPMVMGGLAAWPVALREGRAASLPRSLREGHRRSHARRGAAHRARRQDESRRDRRRSLRLEGRRRESARNRSKRSSSRSWTSSGRSRTSRSTACSTARSPPARATTGSRISSTSSATKRWRAAIEVAAGCPSPMGQIVFEHFHGAATRVPVVGDRLRAPLLGLQHGHHLRVARSGA